MQEIANDLWQIEGPEVNFIGGVMFPTSSIVIRLPDRSLLVYSPVPFDDAAAAAIDAVGDVAHIVAPNRWHHLFAVAAARRWPGAAVYAAPGVAAKQPDLRIDHKLGEGAPWGDAIGVELVGGARKVNEVVLFHRASGTLVCADLVFHIARPANWRTRLALALDGAGGGRLAQGRSWRLLRTDRAAARASAHHILEWPIARVAPCHGTPIEIDAAAFAPHLTRLCGARIEAPPRDPRTDATSAAVISR